MDAELAQNKKGIYEIWVDKKFIAPIPRLKDENLAAYAARSNKEFDNYIARMRSMSQSNGSGRTVKKITI